MKHNNFITTLSPQQQYEIRRWFILSSIIMITTMGIALCYFAPQIYSLYSIKKEISFFKTKNKDYTTITNIRNKLKKENELLQKKRGKINTYLLSPKNPLTYIPTLTNTGNKNIIVEQIRNNKKNIEIIILCPNTESATLFVQHITDSGYFINTKITSLQQHEQKNQFKCFIKTSLKKRVHNPIA